MTSAYILPLNDPHTTLEIVGGKGQSLSRLANAGFSVPDGFHVTTTAYIKYVAENNLQTQINNALANIIPDQPSTFEVASKDIHNLFEKGQIPPDLADEIVDAYTNLIKNSRGRAVAVRSSATAEDLPDASFAGQQDTFLNVTGSDAVLNAVKKCWASLWTARAISYRARKGILPESVALAVVVQIFIPAEAAGILFTANPLTGNPDQMVISASWGLGEAIVGGQVTPDMLTLEKTSGKLVEQKIADKQFFTVPSEGGTSDESVPKNLRQKPVLNEELAKELGQIGIEIEKLYLMPMDIEWTLFKGKFNIVQARPITTLPENGYQPPVEWPMPDPKGRYMRASIADLLPDPLSPLFASLGLSHINRGISEGVVKDLLRFPSGIISNFMLSINGYAYQDVSFSVWEWLMILIFTPPGTVRMLRTGVKYWQELAHPRYFKTTSYWREQSLTTMSPEKLWQGVNEVMLAFSFHLASLMGSTMGPSSSSELVFAAVYEKLVKQEGDPPTPDFLMGFENAPLASEKTLFDLAMWCKQQTPLGIYFENTAVDEIVEHLVRGSVPLPISPEVWQEWQQRFNEYLDRHGYSIYDMDFAKSLPRDEPAPIINMLKLFLTGDAKNPYLRQENLIEKRDQAVALVYPRLKGIKRWAFEKTLKWAQTQAPLREDGIAEIGLGYPILRDLLHELGRRFVEIGALKENGDIFWLEQTEVETLIAATGHDGIVSNFDGIVEERKAQWETMKKISPPPQLPPSKKYLGIFSAEGFLADTDGVVENMIKGVATSSGVVTAPARVLHGQEDFDQMRPGEILVAGITTPAWTPLFAMAAGVITDIGGPLSHGSIVAREYGIPAVLGTGVATQVIHNGDIITLDGSAGTITLPRKS